MGRINEALCELKNHTVIYPPGTPYPPSTVNLVRFGYFHIQKCYHCDKTLSWKTCLTLRGHKPSICDWCCKDARGSTNFIFQAYIWPALYGILFAIICAGLGLGLYIINIKFANILLIGNVGLLVMLILWVIGKVIFF